MNSVEEVSRGETRPDIFALNLLWEIWNFKIRRRWNGRYKRKNRLLATTIVNTVQIIAKTERQHLFHY